LEAKSKPETIDFPILSMVFSCKISRQSIEQSYQWIRLPKEAPGPLAADLALSVESNWSKVEAMTSSENQPY
jgi:hypothetical protein